MLPLAGDWTFDSFCDHVGGLDLFAGEQPSMPAFRNYRRWAFESAALDLALRQAGTLARRRRSAASREPISFVVSLRLGEPPSADPVTRRLAAYPGPRFKLDSSPVVGRRRCSPRSPTPARSPRSTSRAPTRARRSTSPTDPELYRRCAEAFPDAWLEDPDLTVPEADAALRPYRDRITWDAPIHGVADIEALPFLPRDDQRQAVAHRALSRSCCARTSGAPSAASSPTAAGSPSWASGAGQIQYLASLFHPHEPNDIAPSGYDWARVPRDRTGPLAAAPGHRRHGLPPALVD